MNISVRNRQKTDNPPIRIYVNKIEHRITFTLIGSTEKKIDKNKIGEDIPHLKITEVVLVHGDIVNNDHQHDSRVFYTFVPNKSCGQLLEISLKNFVFLGTFTSQFSYI